MSRDDAGSMPSPGRMVAHYRLIEKIGEGGMGVVWKALDTKLDREVAVKFLPATTLPGSEGATRFAREAKLLAALNHERIASIYGVEQVGEHHGLVMELVDGPTLDERMRRGPLPPEEALTIALQIAEALEFAHDRGIVHRDLKPANVKLRSDGGVKVLDFGLAKAMTGEDSLGSADPSHSPTMTFTAATQAGMILGTASYMAPEQAAGTAVDRRADVWAFGVVLWEMLTGRRLFAEGTVTQVLASVIKDDIDLDALPPTTPRAIRELIGRCLRRKRSRRLQSIGDARVVLEEALEGDLDDAPTSATDTARSRNSFALTGVLAAAVLVLGAIVALQALTGGRETPTSAPPIRLAIPLPEAAPFLIESYPGHSLAISRDGTTVAYRGSGYRVAEDEALYLRRLDDLEVRSMPGTDTGASQPFFSPDGSWVAYFDTAGLNKVAVSGGPPVRLARMSGADWLQGSWSDDNRIVYDTWNDGLRVLDADGGSPRVLTQPKGEWHLAPRMLPGSTRLLFFVQTASEFRIESLTLDDPTRQTVLDNASHPTYLASGHLLFVRDGALMVAPFDVDSLLVTGSPRPIELGALVDHVNVAAPTRQLAVSLNGTLVYAPSPESVRTETSLVWVDRQGRAEDFARVPFAQPHFRFSSDGQKLIISGRGTPQARYDVLDVTRRTLTPFYAATSDYPAGALWSADGERLYLPNFGTHVSQLLERSADGGLVEVLFEVEGTWLTPAAVTDDDRYIVFFFYQPETAGDIWYFDRQAPEGQRLHPFAAEAGSQYHPALSPDGKWLAYASTGSEGTRVYVRRFPEGDALTAVAPDNGWAPIWAPDGSELYFTSIGHDELIVVPVDIGEKPTFGKPRRLPLAPYQDSADVGISWAVHPDGERFLFAVQEYDPTLASRLVVVQNWFGDLERLFEP